MNLMKKSFANIFLEDSIQPFPSHSSIQNNQISLESCIYGFLMKSRVFGAEPSFSSTNWWLLILPPMMTLHESKVDLTRITHTVDTDNTNIIIRNHLVVVDGFAIVF